MCKYEDTLPRLSICVSYMCVCVYVCVCVQYSTGIPFLMAGLKADSCTVLEIFIFNFKLFFNIIDDFSANFLLLLLKNKI